MNAIALVTRIIGTLVVLINFDTRFIDGYLHGLDILAGVAGTRSRLARRLSMRRSRAVGGSLKVWLIDLAPYKAVSQ